MTDDTQRRPRTPFDLGKVRVDPARLCIVGPSGPLHLEPRVMDVLVTLAERAPEPVTRGELIDAVWGDAVVTDSVLSRCISILRERLGDDRASPRFIETLSKRGYRLLAPVGRAQVRPSIGQPVGPPRPASGVSSTQPAHASAVSTVSVAVLPFVNLAANATDEHGLKTIWSPSLTHSKHRVILLRRINANSKPKPKPTSPPIKKPKLTKTGTKPPATIITNASPICVKRWRTIFSPRSSNSWRITRSLWR